MQIVVPSVNNGAVFRAGKGRTASDFNGNILLQIIHAAAHTQQPRSKLPVADSGSLAGSSDFLAYLRKNIPQDFFALFSMLPLKYVEMQGECYFIIPKNFSSPDFHLIMTAFKAEMFHPYLLSKRYKTLFLRHISAASISMEHLCLFSLSFDALFGKLSGNPRKKSAQAFGPAALK